MVLQLSRLIGLLGIGALATATAVELPPFAGTREVLEEYCFDCHNAKKAKGAVNLEQFADAQQAVADYRLWERVREQLSFGDMPPEGKSQPSDSERKGVEGWINKLLDVATHANAGDPGRVVMRRLTNDEYDYALRDLTGQDFDIGRNFPGDGGGGEGFSNTGGVLFISPERLEKYIDAARTVSLHAEIMPGTGITFMAGELGPRGPAQMQADVEKASRNTYNKLAAPIIPADVEAQRIEEYLRACWHYRHRDVLGDTTLDQLATKNNLNRHFLANWWRYLNSEKPVSAYLDFDRKGFAALPGPMADGKVPDSFGPALAKLAADRQSWYKTQRQQQDVNAEKPTKRTASLAKRDYAYLVVTDANDGNTGDRLRWTEITLKRSKGVKQSLYAYLKELKTPEAEALLATFGRKWDGTQVPNEQVLYVEAPSLIHVPLPADISEMEAVALILCTGPEALETSLQVEILAQAPATPLPPILPGKLVMMNRPSNSSKAFWKEYGPLREIFPDTLDRRLVEVADNFQLGDRAGDGVYYLSHAQLLASVPAEAARLLDALREDWRFVGHAVFAQLATFRKKYDLNGDDRDAPLLAALPEKEQKAYTGLIATRDKILAEMDEKVLAHLRQFAEHAWRRPVQDVEAAALADLFRAVRQDGADHESAGRVVLTRILSSPHFLYRGERGSGPAGEQPVTAVELASRLSFFLWSSIPDDTLRQADLLKPEVRQAQVQRMLQDPKAAALASQFAGQWLKFHEFPTHSSVDRTQFPDFTDQLRADMYREAVAFCTDIVRSDRSVREFFWSKHTFLNADLAKFYGIPGISGDEFRRVDVAAYHRGGLLGMGAVLTKTSYPLRTSPVVRGHYLLDTVLGGHVPPPPSDVPPLEETRAEDSSLSVRARLEIHRNKPACAGCHDRIDPLGFALENFDPVGRWRETAADGTKLDVSGVIEGSEPFAGPDGLRTYLNKKENEILRNFCRKLVGYALGRELLLTDRPLIDDMMRDLQANEYRFSVAVQRIVGSRQFLNRINEAEVPPAARKTP